MTAALLPAVHAVAGTASASSTETDHAHGRLFTTPDKALGEGWQKSSDISVIGTGDSAGFHVLRADESTSFTYREVADLTETGLDGIGAWTGYVCTTGSGRYAAAVYAPSMAVNKPDLLEHGAFGAVVDLDTGKTVKAVTGVQLAYFSPGCGTDDTVAFTRSSIDDSGKGDTTVFDVDAASGTVLHTVKVAGQLTNPLPAADGDLGVLHGKLVRVSAAGTTTALADLPGPLFALAPSEGGAVDLATVENGKDVLHRWNGRDRTLADLGTAPLGSLNLFPQAHGDLAAGDVAGIRTASAPGLKTASAPRKPVAASHQGHLLTTGVSSKQLLGLVSKVGEVTDATGAGALDITALATATGTAASATVTGTSVKPAVVVPTDDTERVDANGHTEAQILSGGVTVDNANPDSHNPTCLAVRNDVHTQALQPSPNMVEWATDQAVHGDLTVTRPANYLATGNAAYSPQGLFPRTPLSGGGEIPAQVMLGILAQESNFKQASWHAVPGDSGNPLIGDYYGNGDSIHYYPFFQKNDCGYGIAQVTSGMSSIKGSPFTSLQASAVATDYAANIAAGVRILGQTWNELKLMGMTVNSGDPQFIESWAMALWGYNSGVYTDTSQNGGRTGVGWLNNPANPTYLSDRQPFLRASYADAATPGNWPYQERVMGWAETPQLTYNADPSYAKPHFFNTLNLNLDTDYFRYCTSANHCTPNDDPHTTDACPAEDATCWFHGSVDWGADDSQSASTESLVYALGSAEPALDRQYPEGACASLPGGNNDSTLLIDDLPDPNDNVFGCHETNPEGGKFKLRFGDNFTFHREDGTWRATEDIAPIDLHQIGGGYDGHFWFTHAYQPTDSNYLWHRITATWSPDRGLGPANIPPQEFDIYIHLPDHGAQATVQYTIDPGPNSDFPQTSHSCPINQANHGGGTDRWLELGSVPLSQGAHLTADNTSYANSSDGTLDVAFDAVAFVPLSGKASSSALCWNY